MYPERERSDLWFLLPIFVGIIGGIVAYFVLRKDDPKKAKNCMYLALVLLFRDFLTVIAIGSQFPDLEQQFAVNV